MSPSKFYDPGAHFDNGYQSEGLAQILEVVMQNQNAFTLPPNLGRPGLLQITTPTEEESTAAAASVRQAYDCVSSALAELNWPEFWLAGYLLDLRFPLRRGMRLWASRILRADDLLA